jgi:hypothetical protein
MYFFNEMIFAEPTVFGYIGAGIFHLTLWMYFGSWECGVMKYLQDYIKRRAPMLYHETVVMNHKDEPVVEMLGLQDDPAVLWISNFYTFAHHGTAGLLMLLGIITGRPWIWRHGLLTQLWGCDIADFIRIALCMLLPPGPFPMRNTFRVPVMIAFLTFHHTTSLLAGIPGSVYLQDSMHFQWMGCFLAGAPIAFVGWDLFARCVPYRFRRFHMASGVYVACMFVVQRVIVFLPMAWALSGIVINATMPLWAKTCLFIGGFNMTLFNFICSAMMFHGIAKKYWDADTRRQCDDELTVHTDIEVKDIAPILLGRPSRYGEPNDLKCRVKSDKSAANMR